MEVKPPELIYGYPVRDLVVVAELIRNHGAAPEDLRELCYNLEFAIGVIRDELEKVQHRALETMLYGGFKAPPDDFKPLGHSLLDDLKEENNEQKE